MKYPDFLELTSLLDDDILLVHEASTMTLKKIKLSTLKQYIGVVAAVAPTSPIPTDYSLWLKADKGIIFDGSTITTWQDQSGNSFNAVQPIKANQPILLSTGINGKPVVRFDGIDDYLFADAGVGVLANRSIFLVVKTRQYASNLGIFALRSATNLDWNSADGMTITTKNQPDLIGVDAAFAYNSNPGTDPVSFSLPLMLNVFGILSCKFNNNIAKLSLNSTNITNESYQINHVANTGGYVIGARGVDTSNYSGRAFSYYGAIDMAEVIVYNRALTNTDEQIVIDYLNNKYNVY